MRLVVFNAETCKAGEKGQPRINISSSGLISINHFATQRIGLQPGNRISFVNDSERPQDWYIFKDENGFILRAKIGKRAGLIFNNSKLVSEIKRTLEFTGKSVTFPISVVPTKEKEMELYGIITRKTPRR